MSTTLEIIQWIVIGVLGIICVLEYLFLSMIMQQIDDIEDRFIRLLNDNEPTPSHPLERMRAWRNDTRIRSKL